MIWECMGLMIGSFHVVDKCTATQVGIMYLCLSGGQIYLGIYTDVQWFIELTVQRKQNEGNC